jgi:hypothetical protein
VRPDDTGLTIDPLPCDVDMAELTDLAVAGHSVAVKIAGDTYEATIDGDSTRRPLGEPLRFNW